MVCAWGWEAGRGRPRGYLGTVQGFGCLSFPPESLWAWGGGCGPTCLCSQGAAPGQQGLLAWGPVLKSRSLGTDAGPSEARVAQRRANSRAWHRRPIPGHLGPRRPAWAAGTGEGRLARVSGELARQSLGVQRGKSSVVIKVQARRKEEACEELERKGENMDIRKNMHS